MKIISMKTIFIQESTILIVLFDHKHPFNTNEDFSFTTIRLNKIWLQNCKEFSSVLYDIWEHHVRILELKNYSNNYIHVQSMRTKISNIKFNVVSIQMTCTLNIWAEAEINHTYINYCKHKKMVKIFLLLSKLSIDLCPTNICTLLK